MKHLPSEQPHGGYGSHRVLSRRRLVGMAAIGATGVTLTGCGATRQTQPVTRPGTPPASPIAAAPATDFAARFAQYEPADEPVGDLAKVTWPQWMAQMGAVIRQLYEFQILNGPLMRYMPCFCGCQNEDGHQNNRDCYIDTVNADGAVVFDSMAPT